MTRDVDPPEDEPGTGPILGLLISAGLWVVIALLARSLF